MVWTSSCPSFWHGEMDGSSRPHSSSWQDFNMRRKSGINQIFCPWAMITPNRKLLYTCNYLEATNITASAMIAPLRPRRHHMQRLPKMRNLRFMTFTAMPGPSNEANEGGRVKRWVSLLRFLVHSWCRLSMLYLLSKSSFCRRFMFHVCFDSSTG